MKITAARIQNFKRVEDVTITPGADRTLILIGGKNRQGKSSTLDALTAAFGGKRAQPADPVRHGAEEASIDIELDGGELTVRRVIQPDGESQLEVRDRMGAVKGPQALLDKLVGARFLDPIQFLQLPAKEQRAQLMKMIEGADRIAGLNEKRERAFSKRTEVGRDLTKAEGELARLPSVEVGTTVDVAALSAEAKQLDEKRRAADGQRHAVAEHKRLVTDASNTFQRNEDAISALQNQIAGLQSQLDRAVAQRVGLNAAVEDASKAEADAATQLGAAQADADAIAARRDEIDAAINAAGEQNRKVVQAETHMKRRAEAGDTVTKLGKERDDLTKVIETIDARKAEILSAAKLPVEGLSVDDDGITLGGVPFAQASGAEKLRVALALAIAGSPGLADVWIRDGALLDEESLALVQAHAKSTGNCVWVERVGSADPGVIVISNGKVAS